MQTKTDHFQVCKTVCETHFRDACETRCKPVCETHYRTVCQTTCRPVNETVMRAVCTTAYRDCTETVMQVRTHTVCEPVTTMKTVSRRVPETHCETSTVPGRLRLVCVPRYTSCFDPCTCQTYQKQCGTQVCLQRGPCETRTRQVCSTRTVCEQVPCTTYVRRTTCERVPVTVCKKVPYTVTHQIPVTITRMVRETHAQQVPVSVTRMVSEVVRKRVPYTVTRTVRGCYCDAAECGGATPGPNGVVSGDANVTSLNGHGENAAGRVFIEGGVCTKTSQYATTRMVPETQVRQVPYIQTRTVAETIIKKVPYTVTRMVPTTVEKLVPVTTCRLVKEEGVKQVPTTVCTTSTEVVSKTIPVSVCKMVPYTVTQKVPYCTTEMVPTTITKKVPVSQEYEVSVRKPRWVCVYEACPIASPSPAPATCLAGPAASASPGWTGCSPCKTGPLGGFFKKLFQCRLACDFDLGNSPCK